MNRASATFLGVVGVLLAAPLIMGAPAYSSSSSSDSPTTTVALVTPLQMVSLWVALVATLCALVAVALIWWRLRLAGWLLVGLGLGMVLALALYSLTSATHPDANLGGHVLWLVPGLLVLAAGAIAEKTARSSRESA